MLVYFFFNDTATTEIYTLSLHDALPILVEAAERLGLGEAGIGLDVWLKEDPADARNRTTRSEEHTSELQSHHDLVCRLLLEKKNKTKNIERQHDREQHGQGARLTPDHSR